MVSQAGGLHAFSTYALNLKWVNWDFPYITGRHQYKYQATIRGTGGLQGYRERGIRCKRNKKEHQVPEPGEQCMVM
jgi:hypothetical protein